MALLFQLQQLSHNLSGLNESIIGPLNIAGGEWISDVSAAANYSLCRTGLISEIIGCNTVDMSKYRYEHLMRA